VRGDAFLTDDCVELPPQVSASPHISAVAARRASSLAVLAWALTGTGLALRLVQYLSNRSLWWDEATIALDVLQRSSLEFLRPSATYNQTSPLGFLLLERLATQIFGSSEYALRLVPFVLGILSLFLFHAVARRLLKPVAVPIAVGLFAFSGPLVYFSSEVKHYSTDVAAILALVLAAIHTLERRPSTARLLGLAVLGAFTIWLSFVSLFALAGIALTFAGFRLASKDFGALRRQAVVYGFWGLSFLALYFIYLHGLARNESLLAFWRGDAGPGSPPFSAFMPFPPTSIGDVHWFVATFFSTSLYPIGLELAGLGALAFLVGSWTLWRDSPQRIAILTLPILLALIASSLEAYPFSGRTILFTVPLCFLIIAAGAQRLLEEQSSPMRLGGILVVALLFLHPVLGAAKRLVQPETMSELKPALAYLVENRRSGDVVYVNYGSTRPLAYYAERYGIRESDLVVSENKHTDWSWDRVREDVERFRGQRRVWLLFSGVYTYDGLNEQSFFLYFANLQGLQIDSFEAPGVSLFLYDMADGAGFSAADCPNCPGRAFRAGD
jgi:Dolichyl-phosphate-mannose-protein mannosyltransferase